MRSADIRWHRAWRIGLSGVAGALVCAALGGCSALSPGSDRAQLPPVAAAPDNKSGSDAGSAKPGKPAKDSASDSSRPAAGGGPTGPEAPQVPPAVSPEVLRAFDAALQALQDGHAEVAERGFRAIAESNPELGGPHANLGIIYRRADKIPQAVTELEQAVKSNPQQAVYWNQLGIAYRQQGQFGKAREAYEKAIALDPSYPSPNLNLGVLFDLYLWDSKRALELYDRYLVLSPGGDEKVSKWVADLKNRNRERAGSGRKEQE